MACDLFFVTTTEFSLSRAHPSEQDLRVAPDQLGPTGEVGVETLHPAVVEREHVVFAGLDEEQALKMGQHLRVLCCQVVGLGPVVGPIELPDVVVDCR